MSSAQPAFGGMFRQLIELGVIEVNTEPLFTDKPRATVCGAVDERLYWCFRAVCLCSAVSGTISGIYLVGFDRCTHHREEYRNLPKNYVPLTRAFLHERPKPTR